MSARRAPGRPVVKGRTWKTCPKCGCSRLRVIWQLDNGETVRRIVCPISTCDYTAPFGYLDRKVHTLLSFEDAQALRDVLHTAQSVLDTAVMGQEDAHRGWMTVLQQRINMIPAKLRAKIEREGA